MSFVTRSGPFLHHQGKPFRFLSFNTPSLHVLEDPYWQRVDPFEIRDTLSSVSQMGGQVVRIYTLSIPKTHDDQSRHVRIVRGFGTPNCSWTLNEDLLKDLDMAIHITSQYNIKVIIPFIDHWDWWGGTEDFGRLFGMERFDFYHHPDVKAAFKELIKGIVLRNSSITGIPYNANPTILGWETGNELSLGGGRVPSEWTIEISKFIKQIDKNHLVLDGSYGKYGWDREVLEDTNIDIYSNHYYPDSNPLLWMSSIQLMTTILLLITFIFTLTGWYWSRRNESSNRIWKYRSPVLLAISLISFAAFSSLLTFFGLNQNVAARLINDKDLIHSYNKVFLVGEIGLMSAHILQAAVDEFVNADSSGLLIWSLRGHSRHGGYIVHAENGGYFSYHYPGFPKAEGFHADEEKLFEIVEKAIASMNLERNLSIPNPPEFLDFSSNADSLSFNFRGSAGASNYSIISTDGSRSVLKAGILDNRAFTSETSIPKISNVSLEIVAFGSWGNVSSGKFNV